MPVQGRLERWTDELWNKVINHQTQDRAALIEEAKRVRKEVHRVLGVAEAQMYARSKVTGNKGRRSPSEAGGKKRNNGSKAFEEDRKTLMSINKLVEACKVDGM